MFIGLVHSKGEQGRQKHAMTLIGGMWCALVVQAEDETFNDLAQILSIGVKSSSNGHLRRFWNVEAALNGRVAIGSVLA